MSVETDLTTLLKEHAGLLALVSGRVYPVILPQAAAMPAVTYQRVSAPRNQVFTDAVAGTHVRFQLNAWGRSFESAKLVTVQLRAAILTFTAGGSAGAISIENDIDLYEDETKLYHTITDVVVLLKGDG